MSDEIIRVQAAVSQMAAQTAAPSEVAPSVTPSAPSKSQQIDSLIVQSLSANVRVNNDGSTETLQTAPVESANSHNADVTPPPSLEDLGEEMNRHNARAANIRDQLAQQIFNRNTGQPDGLRVTGADRVRLERELQQCKDELNYTALLIMKTSDARIAYNQRRAAEAANSAPSEDPMVDAVHREQAISELAGMPGPDGRPVGRIAAQREYDAAQLRAKADQLARRK
jgi:hypothetical protein